MTREEWEHRRQQRRKLAIQDARWRLNKLNADRADILAEFRRVSEIYARHLERLNKLAARNVAAMKGLQTHVSNDFQFVSPQPGSPPVV